MVWTLQDRYGLANGESVLDAQQDYDLIDAYENDTHTVMRFRRNMLTCDHNDLNITVTALAPTALTFFYAAFMSLWCCFYASLTFLLAIYSASLLHYYFTSTWSLHSLTIASWFCAASTLLWPSLLNGTSVPLDLYSVPYSMWCYFNAT